jgi:hypothetical protein
MEKIKLEVSFPSFLAVLMHKFLLGPSCPAPLMGWDIMETLSMVLVMGHLPGLLVLQKGHQRAYETLLEVDQQVSPSAWYDEITRKAKTAIPVKTQLKDPNHFLKHK